MHFDFLYMCPTGTNTKLESNKQLLIESFDKLNYLLDGTQSIPKWLSDLLPAQYGYTSSPYTRSIAVNAAVAELLSYN